MTTDFTTYITRNALYATSTEPHFDSYVMGTEGDGLPQAVIDASDYVVKIPMHHGVDSLNVGNAAAIAFWELAKGKTE